MRVAVAIWNGRISPVLDVARQVLMIGVENGRVAERREASLPGTDPRIQAARLAELGADVLVCGAASRPMLDMLNAMKIKVVPFVAGDIEQVVAAWLAGALPNPALSMPGCCGQWRHGRCGIGRGRRAWTGPGASAFMRPAPESVGETARANIANTRQNQIKGTK